MNLSSRSLWATVLVLGSIAIGYFFVLPRWNAYQQANSEVANAQAKQESLKQAQAQLNSFLDQYRQHTNEAKLLNDTLPLSKSELANILNNLDVLTKTSGMTLGQLDIVDTPASDSLGAVPNSIQEVDLSLSGSGTYEQLRALLAKFESNLRIMDVTSLNLGSADNKLSFDLNFKTYYQK